MGTLVFTILVAIVVVRTKGTVTAKGSLTHTARPLFQVGVLQIDVIAEFNSEIGGSEGLDSVWFANGKPHRSYAVG